MNEIAERKTSELEQAQEKNAMIISSLERIACNPDADINKLERLWEMQQQETARGAKMAYNAAMAGLQSKMPVIAKNGAIVVNGVERSKYSKYEDIMRVISPLLNEFGISISFETEFPQGAMKIIGEISHSMGHSKKTDILLPIDSSGSKNGVQAVGSTTSYGMRYVLKLMLNIADGQTDDDGHGSAEDQIGKLQYAVDRYKAMGFAANGNLRSIAYVRECLDSGDIESAAQGYWEILQDDQEALYVAPTKGGAAWRTSDIKAIKEEFGQYHPNRKDEK